MKATCKRGQKAAAVYCTAQTAFFCGTCDGKARGTNAMAPGHTRHVLCDLCESAPATVFCKNDDARLCAACDGQIHGSNPLAARHERVPLSAQSFPETQNSVCTRHPLASCGLTHSSSSASLSEMQVEAVPELPSLNLGFEPVKETKALKDLDAFDFDVDLFDMGMGFDLGTVDMAFFSAPVKAEVSDGVVPHIEQSSCCSSENESASEVDGMAQQTSFTSSETTLPFSLGPSSPTNDAVAAMPIVPTPASAQKPWSITAPQELLQVGTEGPMTREARVLRYRQKRARRTFQKTIRYQSRKAYAEIRPRIKGRFATREEVLALKAEQALHSMAAAGVSMQERMVPCVC